MEMKIKLINTAIVFMFFLPLFAQAAEMEDGNKPGLFYIAKGVAIGLAALGGALGQGKLVAAALEGIARNPGAAGQVQTPMILGIAFVESLVIFALIICFTM